MRVYKKDLCMITLILLFVGSSAAWSSTTVQRNEIMYYKCNEKFSKFQSTFIYAGVNGHLELNLLKGHQRFDAISTSNLEVYKFRHWWIFTYFIFGHDESSPNNIWSMVNLERTWVLLFYYFLYFKVNLDLEETNQLGEFLIFNFNFAVVNLDPIIFEKRWIDGESWPNDLVEKVNRGEDLRSVDSRCPLTRALIHLPKYVLKSLLNFVYQNGVMVFPKYFKRWKNPISVFEITICSNKRQQIY